MSYQVLARKWRPRNFATLVGQEHVVRALSHALSENRLHHAYLFTGTRGVGKTTIARILAKSLNCERGVSATPCGVCSSCGEIDSGRFVDLLEVDAATNTKVDEMRQLLENAVYAPTRGRYKVYVIDEVHMLSNSAFNAMLKTLEEPPEHVKFILATTDPQKIPVTVLSRCLQFNLKQMPPAAICSHLARILEAEAVPFETPALNLIARSAAGSMRDALSLLDQAIAHGAGRVEEGQVRDMLGNVDLDYLYEILQALLERQVAAMLRVAAGMSVRNLSFANALQELANLLTRVQIAQFAPETLDDDDPDRARLLALAEAMDRELVQLAYQIVVQGRAELALAPDEYAGFVMTLLRLHAFAPEVPGRQVASLPANVTRTVAVPVEPGPVRAAIAPVVSVPTSAAPVPVTTAVRSAADSNDWLSIVGQLKLNGLGRELAQQCEMRERTAGSVLLRLAANQSHLNIKTAQEKLQQALSDYLGQAVSLRIEIGEVASETPAVVVARDRQERQDAAVASIEQDMFVRDVIEQCDASLVGSSIKPLF